MKPPTIYAKNLKWFCNVCNTNDVEGLRSKKNINGHLLAKNHQFQNFPFYEFIFCFFNVKGHYKYFSMCETKLHAI